MTTSNSKHVCGKLFVCATPIGNLSDITLRVLETLKMVDLIAAEDTRTTLKLLNHYGIKKPVESYKGYAEQVSAEKFIKKLQRGQDIALVSDAGLPGISDPGYKLIRECVNQNIEIEVLPGATAMTTALVYSGLPTDKFWFEGFLPVKPEQKKKRLAELSSIDGTLIFYESPKRVVETLQTICETLSGRKIALCRELTKKFEEILRDEVCSLSEKIKHRDVKGEIVIVVEGAPAQAVSDAWIEEKMQTLSDLGISKKDATKTISSLYKIKKSRVYDIGEKLKWESNG